MTFELRKVASTDWNFICDLRVSTMKGVIEQAYGWDDDQQRRIAAESMHGEVVVVNGSPVGVLTLAHRRDDVHLVWMAVAPTMQRQGLGGALIAHCQQVARRLHKPLTLQVLRNNQAFVLYTRFGFRVYDHNGPHKVLMRWDAASESPAAP